MMLLGDFMSALSFLEFTPSLIADPTGQRTESQEDGTDTVSVTFVADEVFVEGVHITDEKKGDIARGFMMFSGFDTVEGVVEYPDRKVKSLDLIFSPVGEWATAHRAGDRRVGAKANEGRSGRGGPG
jgi:hypothetical protein